ncbi:hypothetical protein QAD02_014048 [Eretmocerus hayati]|uniref:Uncharacterized protein n=1 Tax=Eretmocerus hayati TaxID=131215 RepID=A0ACC2P4A8_9HYME|nr:hypothetical protein QAD02_014048 [Eretmocerus hayati]
MRLEWSLDEWIMLEHQPRSEVVPRAPESRKLCPSGQREQLDGSRMMRKVQLRDGVMNVGAIARQLVCWGIGLAASWCCENGHLDSRRMVQSVRISGSMMRALEWLLGNWCAGASATQHGGAVRE